MRQYKLPTSSLTPVTIGGITFTKVGSDSVAIVSDAQVPLIEAFHKRFYGVVRDTAGEAGGGWAGLDVNGAYAATIAFERRKIVLENSTLAQLKVIGKSYKMVCAGRQRYIEGILDHEYPGVFVRDRNTFNSDAVLALEGTLSITTQPGGTMTDGAAFSQQPVVKVLDTDGNVDAGYTGNVTASLAAGAGALGGTKVLACVAGVATFTDLYFAATALQAGAAGVQIMFALDNGDNTVTSNAVTVSAAVASKLGLVAPLPSTTASSGVALAVQPKVAIQDALGRTMTGLTSNVVASKQTGGGSLSGTTTVAAVAGIATFTNLVLTTASTDTLRFTTTSLATVDSAPIVVS